jgi:hypothetical protein
VGAGDEKSLKGNKKQARPALIQVFCLATNGRIFFHKWRPYALKMPSCNTWLKGRNDLIQVRMK